MATYSEYTKQFEEMAATGKTYIAAGGYDIASLYMDAVTQIKGDLFDGIMAWAKSEGVEFGTQEWDDTVVAARFIRKYRKAELIQMAQEELSLLEAIESGDD